MDVRFLAWSTELKEKKNDLKFHRGVLTLSWLRTWSLMLICYAALADVPWLQKGEHDNLLE